MGVCSMFILYMKKIHSHRLVSGNTNEKKSCVTALCKDLPKFFDVIMIIVVVVINVDLVIIVVATIKIIIVVVLSSSLPPTPSKSYTPSTVVMAFRSK